MAEPAQTGVWPCCMGSPRHKTARCMNRFTLLLNENDVSGARVCHGELGSSQAMAKEYFVWGVKFDATISHLPQVRGDGLQIRVLPTEEGKIVTAKELSLLVWLLLCVFSYIQYLPSRIYLIDSDGLEEIR